MQSNKESTILPIGLIVLTVMTVLPTIGGALQPLPRDLEVELALSALPSHLRAEATVYVLNPKIGYETVQPGSNGFHTFVARTEYGAFLGDWPYTVYPDDILVPISFDNPGSKTHMKVYFDIAAERARGTHPEKLKELVNRRFETGQYGPPDKPGISYMLAPIVRGYRRAEENDRLATFSLPHYMSYAPGLTNEDIGSQSSLELPFMLYQTPHAHGLIIHIAGEKERAQIREEHAELLGKLCSLRDEFCLPDS